MSFQKTAPKQKGGCLQWTPPGSATSDFKKIRYCETLQMGWIAHANISYGREQHCIVA